MHSHSWRLFANFHKPHPLAQAAPAGDFLRLRHHLPEPRAYRAAWRCVHGGSGDFRATSLLAPSGAARCAGSSSTAAATSRTLRSAPYPTHDHPWCALGDGGATTPLLPKRRRHYPPQEQATASFRHFPLDPSRLGSAGRTFRNVLELVSTDGGFSFEMSCKTWLLRACFRVAGFQCLTPPHANTEEGRMYTHTPAIPPTRRK
mmetsp:Transcript_7737/g.14255  ORF Transcript_7737/g.14255 Transcript_7737/m.14255 type:complete len:203 (-) Transcript_7737:549-1157(-)